MIAGLTKPFSDIRGWIMELEVFKTCAQTLYWNKVVRLRCLSLGEQILHSFMISTSFDYVGHTVFNI